jgi:hypothetical protein
MKLITHIASSLDIEAMAGETFALSITFSNADGSPYSLNGHTVRLLIQSQDGNIVQWSSPVDISISGNTLSLSKTLPVGAGNHFYQINLTFPNAETKATHQGQLIVLQSIVAP